MLLNRQTLLSSRHLTTSQCPFRQPAICINRPLRQLSTIRLCAAAGTQPLALLLQSGKQDRRGCFKNRALGLSGEQSATLPNVETVEDFNDTINSHDLLMVDFMARWCRKCIYLKPKLERMLREDFPGLPILFIDVNAVPSEIIKTAGVKKMPTIQLYTKGKRGPEHIAAEGAIDALEKIKLMILRNTDLKLPPRG